MRRHRTWTIMFIPDDDSGTRQMRLGPFGVRLIVVLIVLAVVLAGVGVATYWKVASVALEASEVKADNDRLTAEVQKVWQLERLMADMLETDFKIRTRLGIEFPEDWPGYRYRLAPESEVERVGTEPGEAGPSREVANEAGEAEDTALFFVWPVTQGWVTSEFGEGGSAAGNHTGMDIAAQTGTPIRAVADGRTVFAGTDDRYGNLVEIDHGRRLSTRYGHCSRLVIRPEQLVKRGDIIAYVGSTGRVTTGPHLHFEVLKNGRTVDPRAYLPKY